MWQKSGMPKITSAMYTTMPMVIQVAAPTPVCVVVRACSRCKVTWFCDATCQRRSWKGGHKSRCPGLAEGYAAMKKELKDNKTALKDPGRTGA